MVFVWCGSGPVLCCFAVFLLAKGKSGREICGSSLLPFFVCSRFFVCVSMMRLSCEAKEFHIFCILFYRFSHCQDRALERDRPQQRKKKGCKTSFATGILTRQSLAVLQGGNKSQKSSNLRTAIYSESRPFS